MFGLVVIDAPLLRPAKAREHVIIGIEGVEDVRHLVEIDRGHLLGVGLHRVSTHELTPAGMSLVTETAAAQHHSSSTGS